MTDLLIGLLNGAHSPAGVILTTLGATAIVLVAARAVQPRRGHQLKSTKPKRDAA
ncbi:MAG: hypothetical protein AAF909_05760 [Pseudomonadota bacterium]